MSGTMMDTTCPAVMNAIQIDCSNKNISDLTGIQYFDNLLFLNCSSNQLTSLSLLPNFLDTLRCSFNYNLNSLPNLPLSLLELSCYQCGLSSLPNLPTTLIYLNCEENTISSLPSPLPDSLKTLVCDHNNLLSLPVLSNSIVVLYCRYNPLSTLPNLPSTLISLSCDNCQLSTLPSLPINLYSLSCSHNQLVTLPGPYLPWLNSLKCDYNQLSTIPNFANQTGSINMINLSHNPISSLPPLPALYITTLDFSYTSLFTFPVLPNTVNYLHCEGNSYSSLPPLPNSLKLYCSHNNLSSLPALPIFLNYLDCSYNQLTSLPTLQYVDYLDCSFNQLTSLPPLKADLTGLICNDNPSLNCLPPFSSLSYLIFNISNTSISCLPNVIQHPSGYVAAIDSFPLCGIFNPNGCEVAWNIKGTVVHDGDGSCATTNDGTGVQNVKMNLYDNASNLLQQVYINGASDYSFNTNLGTYHAKVDTASLPFNVLCPVSNDYVTTLTAIDSLDYNAYFRLACKPNYDVGVLSVVNGNTFFPNHDVTLHFDAGDLTSYYGVTCNTNGLTGTVTATVSGPVAISSTSSSAYATSSVAGNIITWTVTDFSQLSFTNSFSIDLITDYNAVAGSSVCIIVDVNAATGTDNNPANNSLTQCWTVVNSFDPNVKEVYPQTISSANEWLTYTIHFQNTGTAPAENILVIDTLDSNLEWSTFQLLSFSHENLTQVLPNGIVHFNFPNIFLPDSTTNEPGSHGYIQYRIKPKATAMPGSVIENSASIYFDFNSPVLTNTASTTYCSPPQPEIVVAAICSGNSYLFNGQQYSTEGIYPATLNAASGCDSIAELHLIVFPPEINSTAQIICAGDSFSFNGQQLAVSGNYSASYSTSDGCDSIVNLALMILSPISTTLYQSICAGDVFDFNGLQLYVAGNYLATYNASNGCDSVVNLSLSIEQVNTTILPIGDSLIALSGGTVLWFDCNAQQIIAGATQTVFVPAATGNYAAIITEGNCVDTSVCMNVVTGENELAVANLQLAVFPNPNNGQFNITSNKKINKVEITNLLGQIIYQSTSNQKNISLQLENNGMYFLTVTIANQIVSRKLIVQH